MSGDYTRLEAAVETVWYWIPVVQREVSQTIGALQAQLDAAQAQAAIALTIFQQLNAEANPNFDALDAAARAVAQANQTVAAAQAALAAAQANVGLVTNPDGTRLLINPYWPAPFERTNGVWQQVQAANQAVNNVIEDNRAQAAALVNAPEALQQAQQQQQGAMALEAARAAAAEQTRTALGTRCRAFRTRPLPLVLARSTVDSSTGHPGFRCTHHRLC